MYYKHIFTSTSVNFKKTVQYSGNLKAVSPAKTLPEGEGPMATES